MYLSIIPINYWIVYFKANNFGTMYLTESFKGLAVIG